MEFEHNLVYFVQLTAYMYCNRRLCSQLAMRLSYYSCMWAVIYTVSQKKLDPSSFEHNFGKYCSILIILSLL